jgi:GT2 family glycosyltransferase
VKQDPLISIIIVNYNGKKYLEECLNSIYSGSYKNFEIIVVDNNSSDGSPKFVKNEFPKVKLIEEKYNHGFTGGNNIGYENSNGEYIVLLNNDTKVEKNYLENFIKVFEEYPKCGVAQSKIVLYDNPEILDCAGSFWTPITLLYHYGFLKKSSLKEFNKTFKIFSAKGASMIIKKEVIEKVGLFDKDFWHYYEETDFCHRAINAGYEIYYYPKALCFHKIGISRGELNQENKILFSNTKNKFFSILKNFSFPDVILVLIKHFAALHFYIIILLLNRKFKEAGTIYKAIYWNIKNLPLILKKRNENKFKGNQKILPRKNFSYLFFLKPDKY